MSLVQREVDLQRRERDLARAVGELEAKQREKLFTNLQLDKAKTVPKVEKICNIIDKLPKTSNPGLWFIDNAHLSIDGHKAWARALASCINDV
jgi:lysophospholipase L1-like esterase